MFVLNVQGTQATAIFLCGVLRGPRRKVTGAGDFQLAFLPGGWATFWGQTASCIFKARSAWVTLPKQGATEQAAQGFHQSQPARRPPPGVGKRGRPRPSYVHHPGTTKDHVCEQRKGEFYGKENSAARCAQGPKTQIRDSSSSFHTCSWLPLIWPFAALPEASSLKSRKYRREDISCSMSPNMFLFMSFTVKLTGHYDP